MASEESRWLKRKYDETPTDTPEPKRVKFQTVVSQLKSYFPSKELSNALVTAYIKEAFPNAYNKRCGHHRETHIFGINPIHEQTASSSHMHVDSRLLDENILLKEKVRRLNMFNNCSNSLLYGCQDN